MSPKDFKVPALEKGLQILEVLAQAPEPMSLTDICHALGKNPSELYRMIGFLEGRGYILKESHSGSYSLSLKLYELAHRHSPVDKLIKAAAIPMRMLALNIRESCHLSVLHNGQLLVLYQQESPEKYRFSVEVGASFDVLDTVSGRLLLAHLSAEERSYYLSQHEGYHTMEPEAKLQIEEELGRIATEGCAVAEQDTHLGIKDYTVLVGNPRVGLSAALTVPSLMSARNPNETGDILSSLQACAADITRGMGLGE